MIIDNIYIKEKPVVIDINNVKSIVYDDFTSILYNIENLTSSTDIVKCNLNECSEINISNSYSTIDIDENYEKYNIFKNDIKPTNLYIKSQGEASMFFVKEYYNQVNQNKYFDVLSTKYDKITSCNESPYIYISKSIPIDVKLNSTYKDINSASICVNEFSDKLSVCDYISDYVRCIVNSNNIFYKNTYDDIIYDIEKSRLSIGDNIVSLENESIDVINKTLSKSSVNQKFISIDVGGKYIKPNLDADITDPDDLYSGISNLNIRIQKNNYFEIGMILGQQIIKAENLPDGVYFDEYGIKGSIVNYGKYNSILYLSDAKIDIVFEVDAINRIL